VLIPPCPKWQRGGCPRSDPIVVAEDDAAGDYHTFYCRTCHTGYAVSSPKGRAKAALENELRRHAQSRPYKRKRVYSR
jgi:hypothetical protein